MTVAAWSKSSLSTLLDGCSWQWALQKVHGLPSPDTPANAIGTAYHSVLEEHERARLDWHRTGGAVGDRDGLTRELAEQRLAHHVAEGCRQVPDGSWELHGTSPEAALEAALQALGYWWAYEVDERGSLRDVLLTYRPVAVEPYFNVAHPSGERIHGYIDWLGYDPASSSWVVIDHKTAGSFGRWPEGGGGHEREAAVYLVGSEVAAALPVGKGAVRMEWHIARKGKGKTDRWEAARLVSRALADYDRKVLGLQLQSAADVVAREGYEPNPSWNLCSQKWCAFYTGCQVTGELTPGRMDAAVASP